MMKKTTRYLAALLAALMLLGLCACSAQQTPAETTDTPAATNEAASTTETEEISTEPETTDAEAATRTITDGNGREVEIPQTVESIVCVGVRKQKSGCRSRPEFLIPMSVIAVVRQLAQTGFGCPVTKSCAWIAMRRMTDLTFERFSVDHKYDPLQLRQAIKQ